MTCCRGCAEDAMRYKQMVQQPSLSNDYWVPDANTLNTEDDTTVDNFASAKQQRFLVSSLYGSARERTFLAEAKLCSR